MTLPQPQAIPRGIAIACLFAALLMPLIIFPWHAFPFITGKALYLRALLIPAAMGWLVACLLGQALQPPFRLTLSLLAILAAQAIADLGAEIPMRAFLGTMERQDGYLGLFYFALHVALLTALLRGKSTLWYVRGAVLVSCAVAASALYTAWHWWPQKLAGGTLGNPSYVGIYCAMCAFLAMWLAQERIYWSLAALINLTAAVLTQSRGASMAIFVGMLVGLMPLLQAKLRLWLTALIATTLTLILYSNFDNERIPVWILADDIWRYRPWFGFGQEHFEFISLAANTGLPTGTRAYDRAHNWILDRLIDGGLVTLTAWAWFIFEIARLIGKQARHRQGFLYGCLAAYLTGGLFLFDVQATLATLAALAAAVSERRNVDHESVVVANAQPTLDRGAGAGRTDRRKRCGYGSIGHPRA